MGTRRHSAFSRAAAAVLLLGTAGRLTAVRAENLVAHGDMEAAGEHEQPAGWTGEGVRDAVAAYRGTGGLRLALKGKGGVRAVSDTFSVEPGRWYRFGCRARLEGFGDRTYEDRKTASANALEWLDAEGNPVGAGALNFPYGGREGWQLAEAVVQSPLNAALGRAVFRLSVGTNTTEAAVCIDEVQVGLHGERPGIEPTYTVPLFDCNPRPSFEIVEDAEGGGALVFDIARATHVPARAKGQPGKVLYSEAGRHPAGYIYDRHQNVGPGPDKPGRYRAVFYLKVADNSTTEPAVGLAVNSLNGFLNGHIAARAVAPAEFSETMAYLPFAVPFVRPPAGPIQYVITWKGNADVWYDRLEIVTEEVFSDTAMSDHWPMREPDPAVRKAPRGLEVLVVHGLFTELYGLDAAIGNMGGPGAGKRDLVRCWLRTSWSGWDLEPDFPDRVEDLWPRRTVILSNTGVLPLGVEGRKALADYVALGGRLLVLGGPQALGPGSVADTFLDPLLPVETGGPEELVRLDDGVLEPDADFPPASALGWDLEPCTIYLHRITPRPEAQVHLAAADHPVLISGRYGQGLVVVFAGTVLGEPEADQTPFWEWDYWPLFMERLLLWMERE